MTGRDSWPASWPELAIAALLVAALSGAGYALAGTGGAAVVLIVAACCALLALRAVPPPQPEPQAAQDPAEAIPTMINGFWRKRSDLAGATKSLASYDLQVRGSLQHLLAARLAERHGISLYAEPEAARQLLFPGGADRGLWFWLDPERPAVSGDDHRPGIRPRTLAALIERLERL